MGNGFRDVTAAELSKLRTLPAVVGTVGATLLGTAGLAALLTAVAAESSGNAPASAVQDGLPAIGYGQIGLILLGVLAAASEYGGRQIGTTMASVPRRPLLLGGKIVAYLLAATGTAVLAVAAIAAAVSVTPGERRAPVRFFRAEDDLGPLAGAVAYLVLIGLLGYAVALLTRSIPVALVLMLGLVFVVSPLLTAVTTLAGYLPDRAGAQLYQATPPGDDLATAVPGGLVLCAWAALVLAVAVYAFLRRDA